MFHQIVGLLWNGGGPAFLPSRKLGGCDDSRRIVPSAAKILCWESTKLRVIVEPSADQVYRRTSEFLAARVRQAPCVLGLATGGTMEGVYRELVRMHREEGLDFHQVVTFNLDEYVGLGPSHPQSYRAFMQQHLFSQINILPENTHLPDGRALDFEGHCRQYELRIEDAGGIDLQLLGIGGDGHIAFNEPGSSLGSRTRVKSLAPETVRDNARFFELGENVPRLALTMGVGTILDSRRCLLAATGERKAEAIAATVEGPVTAQVTGIGVAVAPRGDRRGG